MPETQEHINERHKRWVANNRERRRAQQARWYRSNAERIAEENKINGPIRVQKHRDYYEKHPEKLTERALKHHHGLSLREYQGILEAQGGTCAICRGTESDSGTKRLSVDHDHKTGVVRGLLCGRCNRMLGLAKDLPQTLMEAAKYLLKAGGEHS